MLRWILFGAVPGIFVLAGFLLFARFRSGQNQALRSRLGQQATAMESPLGNAAPRSGSAAERVKETRPQRVFGVFGGLYEPDYLEKLRAAEDD